MTPPRVLFGLLSPGLGGHTRTALALAEVLRGRGYPLDFLVHASAAASTGAPGLTAGLVRAAGFNVIPIESAYGRPGAFRRSLRELVRRQAYEVLHWFELHAGVRAAALVAAAERRAFVWTVTSGGVPTGYYGLNRVVVFTREVADNVRRRSPRTAVHVLPARIDFRLVRASSTGDAREHIRDQFAVGEHDLLIVRVARCTPVYLGSVRLGIALAESLGRAGRRAVFLHAGYVEDRGVAVEIRRLVDRANAAAGRPIAHSVTENVESGLRYAAAADVCIGSGRSAIEALALGRPTLVAWDTRCLGMVDADNIHAMADLNFQGRRSDPVASDDEAVGGMHGAVVSRLAAPDEARRTAETCARYVEAHYSVDSAADAYEQLYADRRVTVEGVLAHYANPRHLEREILYRLPPGVRYGRVAGLVRRARSWAGLSDID